MSEQDLIKGAADDIIKELFSTLFQACTVAADAAAVQRAEERFRAGVLLVRQVRDRVLASPPA